MGVSENVCLAVAGFLVFASGLTLILTGVFVARPGIWAEDFEMTTCTAVRDEELEFRQCSCSTSSTGSQYDNGDTCYSVYPCVQVFVEYKILQAFNDTTTLVSMVHVNSLIGVSRSDCSYIPSCSRYPSSNRQAVDNFLLQYATVGTNRTCFYNPEIPMQVIFNRNFGRADILAALIVPGVILGISLILLLIVCFIKVRSN